MNIVKPHTVDFTKNNPNDNFSKIEFRGNYQDYLK